MRPQTARRLRQFHRHIGLFFTPAILFFCVSGAFQTLGLHEDHTGKHPPLAWIATIASIHKDQRLPRARPAPTPEMAKALQAVAKAREAAPPPVHQAKAPSPIPLKAFVLLLALGLILTSLLGATIALTSAATRKSAAIALVLGTAVPTVLLFL